MDGTGWLFFEFFRVLNLVKSFNKGRHIFFLYENVCPMPADCKQIISLFLEAKPLMIDSKFFSAQKRARYFWGNIPGLDVQTYWASENSKNPQPANYIDKGILVQDCLDIGIGRNALVPKIRTVTTRSNSLKQRKEHQSAIEMYGRSSILTATELEKIFGFPSHYTDTGDLCLGRRLQLLGKGWCVSVVKYILTPLRYFFLTKIPSENVLPFDVTVKQSVSE